MSRPDHASLCLLKDLPDLQHNDKVRIAGRVIATATSDTYSVALVEDNGVSVVVDISLCLSETEGGQQQFLPRLKQTVSVIGYVELLAGKELPQFDQAYTFSQALCIRTVYIKAILLMDKHDLDLPLWRQAVEASKLSLSGT